MYRILFLFILLHTVVFSNECLELAYERSTGKNSIALEVDRALDLTYLGSPDGCCCGSLLIGMVCDATEAIVKDRVNPATDTLIESLEKHFRSSDLKIRELVNLKYANALYSFYDKGDTYENTLDMDPDDGCGNPINFPAKNAEDKAKSYREGILLELLEVLHEWDKVAKGISVENTSKVLQ